MENSEVLQRNLERATMVTKRLRELLESRGGSLCETSDSGVGNRNGNGPGIEVKELMHNVERELEVSATVHDLHLECERQRQKRSIMQMEVARLKEEMSTLTTGGMSDCPESTYVGVNSSRILALENMIATSSSSLDLISSQLLEAENRKPVFSGLELWGQFCTLADAEEIMNFLVDVASYSRCLLRVKEVDCREKDSEIRDLKEEMAKLKLRAFVFQRASVSQKDNFSNSDKQVSQQHEHREPNQGNAKALEEEQLEVSSDVRSQNMMDDTLMASGICSSVPEFKEREIPYYPESDKEDYDWNSCLLSAFEYDEPLSPTEAYHLDRCRKIFRSTLLHEESIVESGEISTCSLPSHEKERNFNDQQSSMTATLISAEEPAGNTVGDEQQQQSEIEDLIKIECQLNDENLVSQTVPSLLSMEEPKSSNNKGNGSPAQYDGLNNPGRITPSMEFELYIVDKEADSVSTDKVCTQDELMFTLLDANATVGNNESGGQIKGLSTTAVVYDNQFEASTLFQKDDLVSSSCSVSCACKTTKCECTPAADICGLSRGSTSQRCSNRRVDQKLTAQQELSKADINEKTFAAASIRWGVIRLKYLHGTSKANMFQNMDILREYGVPESNILALLISYPKTIVIASSQFREILKEVKEKGFDPLMVNFILAMVTLRRGMTRTLEKSVDCYKKFGLPDEDVILAFREKPWIMEMPEEKITEVMNYYTNVMGLDPSFVCQRLPLKHSMKKRTVPRGLVAKVLLSKGLIELDHLTQLFREREECFIQNFVTKYEEEVPELLKLYTETQTLE